MSTPRTGAVKRREFYVQAVHILFAIILAQSFILASQVMIPIHAILELDNRETVSTLMFSYLLIVLGWIGYARTTSISPYRDTAWSVARFVLDLVILFGYFYLLQISQTKNVGDFPLVVMAISLMYMLSDNVKQRERPLQDERWVIRRRGTTKLLFIGVALVAVMHDDGMFDDVSAWICVDPHILVIGILTLLIVLHGIGRWQVAEKHHL